MHGAGALLRELEQGGNNQEQQEQTGQNHGQSNTLSRGGIISTLQGEALVQADNTDGNAAGEAQQSDPCIQVAAGHTQNHTQGAAQECQSADHDESAHDKADSGSGAGLGTELLGGDSHNECANNQTNDLGTEVLHNSGAMHSGSTCDVTQEAGDAEAHVGRVAQQGQHNGCQADQAAGSNNQPVNFLHRKHPLFCLFVSIQETDTIIGIFTQKYQFLFSIDL